MNEMLKYLTDAQEFVRDKQDLESIEQMMDVTKDTMSQHFEAYNMFKDQLEEITKAADAAITSLNFYNDKSEIDDTKSTTSSMLSSLAIKKPKGMSKQKEPEGIFAGRPYHQRKNGLE